MLGTQLVKKYCTLKAGVRGVKIDYLEDRGSAKKLIRI